MVLDNTLKLVVANHKKLFLHKSQTTDSSIFESKSVFVIY